MFADEVIDNSRFLSLEFNIEDTAVLHGFAGYFDTRLYADVYLSKTISQNIHIHEKWIKIKKHPLTVCQVFKIFYQGSLSIVRES